jgi:hypothetical protein
MEASMPRLVFLFLFAKKNFLLHPGSLKKVTKCYLMHVGVVVDREIKTRQGGS